MILRTAVVVNIVLTVVAVVFSIWLQQLTPMAIRAENFKTFQEKVADEERDHILMSAAKLGFSSLRPLIVTNVVWITIGCIAIIRKPPVNEIVVKPTTESLS